MTNLNADEIFLLNDLRERGDQSAWDWDADARFAEYLGETDHLISEARESCAPSPLRIAASSTWKKITDRRLRGLRSLVRSGLAAAVWLGTGEGGVGQFGVNRIRSYYIIKRLKGQAL